MRGILVKSNGRIVLDPTYSIKPANVLGHNGLQVGAWWPRVLAAKRDGGHGLYSASFATHLSLRGASSRCTY